MIIEWVIKPFSGGKWYGEISFETLGELKRILQEAMIVSVTPYSFYFSEEAIGKPIPLARLRKKDIQEHLKVKFSGYRLDFRNYQKLPETIEKLISIKE